MKKRSEFLPFCPPCIGKEEVKAVVETVRSGWLTMGPKVHKFEEAFAKYSGVKHAISVNSCTAGLHLSYIAAGINPGDEVITSPITFAATVNMIIHVGAKPVLVDIDKEFQCIDPDKIQAAITKKTKAIVPVHFAGNPCDMKAIMDIAEDNNLQIIEDAAHSVGGSYDGKKKMGSLGNLTSFSFYATKNMTTGEGGMVTTNDDALAARLKILRLHGMNRDAWKRYTLSGSWYYEIVEPGWKDNMTDVNAALGLVQLKKLDKFCKKRQEAADTYAKLLKDLPLILPKNKPGKVWHIYPIQVKNADRAKVIERLKEYNVGTSVFFIPIHYHPAYKYLKYKKGDFPVAEEYFNQTLALPLYPQLKKIDIKYVSDALHEIL
ncbi:MAG: DegT/DnrJ/EryC1/StrS aminotransferase family protein [Candidatus Woesearchaeota archaeon]